MYQVRDPNQISAARVALTDTMRRLGKQASNHLLLGPLAARLRPDKTSSFSPLDSAAREIRLLTLLPADNRVSDIFVTLTTVSLHDQPPYEALSYAWGESRRKSVVTLNGRKFPVTRNLDIALRYLRQPSKARTLWVDAICIDQYNLRERGHQLQQMRAIYSQAGSVLVWLGEVGSHTDEVMEYLADFSDSSYRWLDTPPSDTQLDAIKDIVTRPWWSRMWVIQEVVTAAQEPIVGCGEEWISWDKLNQLEMSLTVSYFSERWEGLLGQDWTLFTQTTFLRKKWKANHHEGLHLGDLLVNTESRFASDARDHVIAALGLANKSQQLSLKPDYKETVTPIYQKATILCIKESEGLETLQKAIRPRRRDLPSWCPDFSKSMWHRMIDGHRMWIWDPKKPDARAFRAKRSQVNRIQNPDSSTEPSAPVGVIDEGPTSSVELIAAKSADGRTKWGSWASSGGASGLIKCSHVSHDLQHSI